ncbi:rhamnogalacturonan lyase [Streptomyces ficellus]|uniref:Rhamnogalacturonan lyase n=1 Tax=Streptomyces ficellus TaxID=1977088 RepID=A0ABT7Z3D0_9ACTN|nr:rhamnogalacturonan lyase [Streptomyces ficellus]MDN3293772.1 rhamnogalacturonan lyase [Streptomyces ficellus]
MQHPHPHPRTPRRRRSRSTPVAAAAVAVAAVVAPLVGVLPAGTAEAAAPARQAERLDRGVVSVHTGSGNLVSWRWLGTDPDNVAFNVYRGGTKVNATPVTGSTNYFHSGAPNSADYTVRAVVGGVEQGDSVHAVQFRTGYRDVPISPPAGGRTPDGVSYTYEANDASVGDLDGDGALDFVLKWQPTNAKDNSQSGYTGNTVIDGVKLDGTRLWRVDLGRNIRSGAHYTQFQVYDYDGDGKAEVAMKTADGTVDGTGKVIGSGSADHRNSGGYVLAGPEYLTMFNGRTGAAMGTVDYVPARGNVASWGDGYGNRVDRFLAGTAYLDGTRPSLIMARGYYTRSVIAAWDWRDGRFTRRWTFDSSASANAGKGYDGQGNHSLSVADVDGDGRDEVVYGAMTVDDNGTGLWTNRLGHGDAGHVGDLNPARAGLEYFKVSEDTSKPGSWMADARTGQVLWQTATGGDNGRGVSADVYAGSAGAESWSATDTTLRSATGASLGREPSSVNFVSWWDGDTTRELLDGTRIDKYGTGGDTRLLTGASVSSNNGSKSTPALSGDILGDWREEVVWRTSDNRALRIYSTPHRTDTRITTLLHDTMYRVGLAWQNTAYNQPPHPGFHIGAGMRTAPRPVITTP